MHVCLCHNLQSHSVNHLVFPMPTTRLISSFCLGHDQYCVGSCIGHLRWCVGIWGVLSRHIATQASYLWHKWRLALPTAGKNKDRMDGKSATPWTTSSWGHFKDCMWWVGNTCVRLSEDPPRSAFYSTACSVRSVGDTVQAEPHCLLQLKHISDQTAAPNTPSSYSWLALKSLPVLPVRLNSPAASSKIPFTAFIHAVVSLCLSESDHLAQIQFPICLVPMYDLK